ncbi:hypothetical protein [Rhodococcus qingshengii]|uniref:hypothetical protein n=1 Tax=Rhodococcus qingshengii TaxID=334542 RepID=UPI0035E24713
MLKIRDTDISFSAELPRRDLIWSGRSSYLDPSRLSVSIIFEREEDWKLVDGSGVVMVSGKRFNSGGSLLAANARVRYEFPWRKKEDAPQWLRDDVAELLKHQGEKINVAVNHVGNGGQ